MSVKHHIIVDMEPAMHKVVGWMAFNHKLQEPVKTNTWPRRTAKIYTSEGMARAAMKLSYSQKLVENGTVTFIPVTVPV